MGVMEELFGRQGEAGQRAGRFIGSGIRRLGAGSAPDSYLGSGIESAAQFVEEGIPTIGEYMDTLNPFTIPDRAARFLTKPRPELSTTTPRTGGPAVNPAEDPFGDPSYPGGSNFPSRDPEVSGPEGFQTAAPGVRFKDSARTPGDATAGRASAFQARPLMQFSGALSPVERRQRQAAMDELDEFYDIAPLEKQAAKLEASLNAQDPLWREREKSGMAMDQLFQQEEFKGGLQQKREQERLRAYGTELQKVQAFAGQKQAEVDSMPEGPGKVEAQAKLDMAIKTAEQGVREMFGIAAGITASSLYDRTP